MSSGSSCQFLNRDEIARYARQIILPEVGLDGQQKLKRAKVLVVGAGGLGCPALLYLASAGIGTLGVVDFDVVEMSNLHRQVLYLNEDIGRLKVEAACERLKKLNPDLYCVPIADKLSRNNIVKIFQGYDLIIDGADNFSTHYLINDACVTLNLPFVIATLLRFEGMITVCNGELADAKRGPTYRCIFREPPASDLAPTCAEVGIIGGVAGVLGTLQAVEAIKYLLCLGSGLSGRLLILDLLKMEQRILHVQRDEAAVTQSVVSDWSQYSNFEGCPGEVREIFPAQLIARLSRGEVVLVDVREHKERERYSLGGTLIPLGSLEQNIQCIPRDQDVIIYCHSGVRSRHAVRLLQDRYGMSNVFNLAGGIEAFLKEPGSEKWLCN